MIQPHNRHMAMSWYLAAVAIMDTIVLLIGESGASFTDFLYDFLLYFVVQIKNHKIEIKICYFTPRALTVVLYNIYFANVTASFKENNICKI